MGKELLPKTRQLRANVTEIKFHKPKDKAYMNIKLGLMVPFDSIWAGEQSSWPIQPGMIFDLHRPCDSCGEESDPKLSPLSLCLACGLDNIADMEAFDG